jgi:hypothetical protein
VVEVTDAAEPGREGDLGHGQVGLVDQPAREVHAAGTHHLRRRDAEVRGEEPPQLPRAEAEVVGEPGGRRARRDQAERTRHHRRGAVPGRRPGRRLGPAAAAGPEASRLRGRPAGEPAHVLGLRWPHAADGTAVDAGRLHAGEEAPVEAGVALADRAVAGIVIEIDEIALPLMVFHGGTLIPRPAFV